MSDLTYDDVCLCACIYYTFPKYISTYSYSARYNGDILTKQCFPRAHGEERQELETGLIPVGASSSLVVSEGGDTRKDDHGNLLTPTFAQFYYIKSLGSYRGSFIMGQNLMPLAM